mmetsp:Transcript_24092/g.44785  ORF Transcript_24092/g.44785 Transcript_24092/m.44785 type:complete len:279 (+) Transcript_24092:549-1385(+)
MSQIASVLRMMTMTMMDNKCCLDSENGLMDNNNNNKKSNSQTDFLRSSSNNNIHLITLSMAIVIRDNHTRPRRAGAGNEREAVVVEVPIAVDEEDPDLHSISTRMMIIIIIIILTDDAAAVDPEVRRDVVAVEVLLTVRTVTPRTIVVVLDLLCPNNETSSSNRGKLPMFPWKWKIRMEDRLRSEVTAEVGTVVEGAAEEKVPAVEKGGEGTTVEAEKGVPSGVEEMIIYHHHLLLLIPVALLPKTVATKQVRGGEEVLTRQILFFQKIRELCLFPSW